jgi:hypothetical protein
MWVRMDDVQPRLEQVYLVFSPKSGYSVEMWERKPSLRRGWDGVTHWAQFALLREIPPLDSSPSEVGEIKCVKCDNRATIWPAKVCRDHDPDMGLSI